MDVLTAVAVDEERARHLMKSNPFLHPQSQSDSINLQHVQGSPKLETQQFKRFRHVMWFDTHKFHPFSLYSLSLQSMTIIHPESDYTAHLTSLSSQISSFSSLFNGVSPRPNSEAGQAPRRAPVRARSSAAEISPSRAPRPSHQVNARGALIGRRRPNRLSRRESPMSTQNL